MTAQYPVVWPFLQDAHDLIEEEHPDLDIRWTKKKLLSHFQWCSCDPLRPMVLCSTLEIQ